MAPFPTNLSETRDCLMPALYSLRDKAGSGVKDLDIQTNFLDGSIDLVVVHRLFTRSEIEDRSFVRKFADRVHEAALIQIPTAKDIRVERRRLHYRGETAKDAKPRKVTRRKAG